MHGVALMKLYPQSNIKVASCRLEKWLKELAVPTRYKLNGLENE